MNRERKVDYSVLNALDHFIVECCTSCMCLFVTILFCMQAKRQHGVEYFGNMRIMKLSRQNTAASEANQTASKTDPNDSDTVVESNTSAVKLE